MVRSVVCHEHGTRSVNVAGCASLGVIYEKGLGVEPDIPHAIKFYQRSCEVRQDRNACDSISRLREVHNLN